MSILEFLNTEQSFSIQINIEAEHIAFLRQGSRKLRSSMVARLPLKNSYLSPRSITSIIFILFLFSNFNLHMCSYGGNIGGSVMSKNCNCSKEI